MKRRLWRPELGEGQVLVWVAVLLVVLLAIAGLAIDGGIGLSQRRQMRNAADAGALAGARELCLGTRAQALRNCFERRDRPAPALPRPWLSE